LLIKSSFGVDYSFGPSPRSSDFHKMFNDSGIHKMSLLRQKTEWFKFHPLHYSTRAARSAADSTFENNAALNSSELTRAAESMSRHNFKVAIETSLGLGSFITCDSESTVEAAAQAAADYEIEMLNRLESALEAEDKHVERIYIDGPFLRLLSKAVKSHSCGEGENSSGQGHSMYKSASIVNSFFQKIHEAFPLAELHLTINIINWKQGSINPYFGTTHYDLDQQLMNFFSIYKRQSAYTLSGFQFDAPYKVVNRTPANSTSVREFIQRVNLFYQRVHNQLGSSFASNAKYSFIINTLPKENFYKLGFLPHNYNAKSKYSTVLSDAAICTKAASRSDRKSSQRTCTLNDYHYYKESIAYADRLRNLHRDNSTIRRLANLTLDFASWHSAPKYAITGGGSYLDLFVGYRNNQTGRVLSNVINRP